MKEYDGFLVDDSCNVYSKRTGHIITPHIGSDGYVQVGVSKCRWHTTPQ